MTGWKQERLRKIKGEHKDGTECARNSSSDPRSQVFRIVQRDMPVKETRTEERVGDETEPDCTDKLSNDRAKKQVPTNYFSLAWTSTNYCEHKALLHPFIEGNSSWTKLGPCCFWRAIYSLWGHVLSPSQMFFLSFVFHFLHLGIQSKHTRIMVACKFLLFLNTVLNP